MNNTTSSDPKNVDFSIKNTYFFEQDYWENGSEVVFAAKPRVFHGFIYIRSCDITVYLPEGRTLFIERGSFLYIPKGSYYRLVFSNITQQPATILINCMLEYDQKDHALASKPTVIPLENFAPIKMKFEKLIGHSLSPSEIKSLLWSLISLWSDSDKQQKSAEADLPLFLKKAVSYIEANTDGEISIAQLSDHCHISQSYLRKQFQRHLGVSPKEFCLQKRLEKAKHYLEMGELNVTEVSRVLGFSGPSYFSRIFKEKMGVAPSDLQKSQTRR